MFLLHFDQKTISIHTNFSEKKSRVKGLLLNILCGVHAEGERVPAGLSSAKQHVQELYTPDRSLKTKVLLGVGMVTIVGVGVFMLVFWSVYKFDTAPFYPQGASFLLPGDGELANHSAWRN